MCLYLIWNISLSSNASTADDSEGEARCGSIGSSRRSIDDYKISQRQLLVGRCELPSGPPEEAGGRLREAGLIVEKGLFCLIKLVWSECEQSKCGLVGFVIWDAEAPRGWPLPSRRPLTSFAYVIQANPVILWHILAYCSSHAEVAKTRTHCKS